MKDYAYRYGWLKSTHNIMVQRHSDVAKDALRHLMSAVASRGDLQIYLDDFEFMETVEKITEIIHEEEWGEENEWEFTEGVSESVTN